MTNGGADYRGVRMTAGGCREGQAATVGQGLCSCRAMPVLYRCVCPEGFKLGVAGDCGRHPGLDPGPQWRQA